MTDQWQPIDSAPKDIVEKSGWWRRGPAVLVANHHAVAVAHMSYAMGNQNGRGDGDPEHVHSQRWSLEHTGTYAEDGDLGFEPTHWMPLLPLPNPPTSP